MSKFLLIILLLPILCLICSMQDDNDSNNWTDIVGYGEYSLYDQKDELDITSFTATDLDLALYGYESRFNLSENGIVIEVLTTLAYINPGTNYEQGSECVLQLTYFDGTLHHILLESRFVTELQSIFPDKAITDFCEALLGTLMDKYGEAGIREAYFGSDHTYIIWEDEAGRELLYELETGPINALWIQYSTPEFWANAEERARTQAVEDLKKF